jgi:hypothetical protein
MEAQLPDIVRVDCRDPAVGPRACEALETHGYVLLDHLLPAGKVQALHRDFTQRYPQYLEDVEHPETTRLNHRRYKVPIGFRGACADPEVYGHPVVVAIVRHVLDADAVLEAFGGVVSLGQSMPQHLHRDGPALFPGDGLTHLPCAAVTFSMPMVALDDRVGTTAIWPGSHRQEKPPSVLAPNHLPQVPLGSAVLWDYRTWHRGEANFTETARPLIYATYARSWYRDPHSFPRPGMIRMDLDEAFLRGVPEDRRGLFDHLSALR